MNLIQELVEAASGRKCPHCDAVLSIYIGECCGHPVYDNAMEDLRGCNELLTEFMTDKGSREQARMRRHLCNFIHKEVAIPALFETLIENGK